MLCLQGVWSTLPVNERKLNAAFRSARSVILIFSVRESGKFQGEVSKGKLINFLLGILCIVNQEQAIQLQIKLHIILPSLIVQFWVYFRFCSTLVRVSSRRFSHPLGPACRHERQDARRSLQNRLDLQVALTYTCFHIEYK